MTRFGSWTNKLADSTDGFHQANGSFFWTQAFGTTTYEVAALDPTDTVTKVVVKDGLPLLEYL